MLERQFCSEFPASVAANRTGDLAKANIVAGVCVRGTELRRVGYAECPRAYFQSPC